MKKLHRVTNTKFQCGDMVILNKEVYVPNRVMNVKAGSKVYIQDVTYVAHNRVRYTIADEYGVISNKIYEESLEPYDENAETRVAPTTQDELNNMLATIQCNYNELTACKRERCDIKHLMEILDSKENASVIFSIAERAGAFKIDLVSNDGDDEKLMFRNVTLKLMKARIEELDKTIEEYEKYFRSLSYYSFNEYKNPIEENE